MTGAQILMECLAEQGVDTVFGYPGGAILDVYNILPDYPGIRHILTTDERGACHAADGYARSMGMVGVCLATSGPGATNLVTGIATAYMDSSPVVCITGNVDQRLLGKDSFQEADIIGITMPVTKYNYQARKADDLADILREAFAIARSGRPGPVLVDIPVNVFRDTADFIPIKRSTHFKQGRLGRLMVRTSLNFQPPEPDHRDIEVLADMIRQSERPMLICGGGVVRSRANEVFEAFAGLIDAPVGLTVMGAGGFRMKHPLCTGLVGMHGSQASNLAVDACDLLIAVGCRFAERMALKPSGFARNAKIVQIDIDRAEIGKNVMTAHHITGDARKTLHLLLEQLDQQHHEKWKEYVLSFGKKVEYDSADDRMTPIKILDVIADTVPKDTIFTTDAGSHQMWAIQHLRYDRGDQLITSGGFGTMGFGLGAAIGAQLGNPSQTVIHITGDGSFRMNCGELSTVQYYGLPIITVLFNNGSLGMIRQLQAMLFHGRYSQSTLNRGPDFVKLAEAYGLTGRRVTDIGELKTALREALQSVHGTVIDCVIDMDEWVRPWIVGDRDISDLMIC